MRIVKEEFVCAPMKYLDKELNGYKNGYPNQRTKDYYNTLKLIKKLQDEGLVPSEDAEEAYKVFGDMFSRNLTVECGYYGANIHYYIYNTCSEFEKTDAYKDAVNARILYLLKNADEEPLFHGWFISSFFFQYVNWFLTLFYEKPVNDYKDSGLSSQEIYLNKLKDMVSEKGTADEKEILERLTKLVADYRKITIEQQYNQLMTGKYK